MEILLWLVPAVVVSVVAMLWAGWMGREGRGEVDRDVALARLAEAMDRDHTPARTATARTRADRSTGIAVRPSRAGSGARPPANGPVG